jgi:hypothetical protein
MNTHFVSLFVGFTAFMFTEFIILSFKVDTMERIVEKKRQSLMGKYLLDE